ncbi:putative membrane protein [Schinkia azotoformans MEV2011]|uniref:Putative membrane protein n=1 Tax=Schinkia azotoformans MEV2011 TaxID=1348973 RepID=A0A072NQQ9_SCHAZ|nr:AzlD domain-containing protein [Schinkia azotoformans]KEF39228.1 putative membrane protein [Schinkia azotoformans MEV2011]MEC1695894.1 AzlD domain-containing protein [Schinkia azotoformans]MEC1717043.1 AzlD domain-containing protein [Schinkia azotoformans]MEC1721733.1 AzlD domain-containing protein [Schinkia azotoformans]MEC1726050.1 AzlD domain-containing protein [Schinkia azotoformans]
MKASVVLYILMMATVTYIIRVLPLTLIRKEIKNTFIKSFLYYVPYVTLAVMIFPAILNATASQWSALIGFVVAIILAYLGGSLIKVSILSCLAVFVVELFIY